MARKLVVVFVGCFAQLLETKPTEILQSRQYGAPPPYGPQSSWAQPSPGPSYGQSLPPPQQQPPQTYDQPQPSPPPPPPPTTYGQTVVVEPQPSPPPVYQQPPPDASPPPPPPSPPPQQSAYGSSLAAGAGPAAVPDFYAAVPSDSPSMGQLFGPLSDGGPLTAGYGKQDEDQVIHGNVMVLPPIEETKEGETHYYNHVYPEIVKNNELVSNKEINTYSVQKHRVNINNHNIHQYVKNIRVNTDYITNIKRINHPHQQVQVLTYIHNKYVPKLYVKHSQNQIVNELPPQEIPTVETQQSVQVLPPIIEAPIAQKIDYNGQVIQTLGGGGGGGDSGAQPLFRSGLDTSSSSGSSASTSAASPTSSTADNVAQQSYSSGSSQQQTLGGNSADASASAPSARSTVATSNSNYNLGWPQAQQQALTFQTAGGLQQRHQQALQQRFIPSPQLLTEISIVPPSSVSSSSTSTTPTYRSSLLTAGVEQLRSYR